MSTLALDTDDGLPYLSRCFWHHLKLLTLAKKKKKFRETKSLNFCGRLPHTRYEAPPQHFVYVPSVAERVVNSGLITAGAHSRCRRSESKKKGEILPFGGGGVRRKTDSSIRCTFKNEGFSVLFWTCKLSLIWTDVQDWLSQSCDFDLTSNVCHSEQRKKISWLN